MMSSSINTTNSDPSLIPQTYEELLMKYKRLKLDHEALLRQRENQEDVEEGSLDPLEVLPSAPTIPASISPSFESLKAQAQSQLHPFTLEPILRHLSTFLGYQALRQCRQVSSTWYFCMTPAFLGKSKIITQYISESRRGGRTGQNPFENDADADISSSDSEEDGGLDSWRTLGNFRKLFPDASSEGSKQEVRQKYWEKIKKNVTDVAPVITASTGTGSTNSTSTSTPELLHRFYILRPPVPFTVHILGKSCPQYWLQTYGHLIHKLQLDFGSFTRREKFGDMEPSELQSMLKTYCPRLRDLTVFKPNYNLEVTLNPMSTAKFEQVTSLEMHIYRSDRPQCVKEILTSVPNLKTLSLFLFSIAADLEISYIEAAARGGSLTKLETLKFPFGLKSTTLLTLVGMDLNSLKKLHLGRIRQTRWLRDPPNNIQALAGFVDPLTLTEFLQNISGTVEELSLTTHYSHADEIWVPLNARELPVMPYLKKLEYQYLRSEHLESFAFLENLPTLKEVQLTAFNPGDDLVGRKLFSEMFHGIYPNLEVFKAHNFVVEFPSIVKLVKAFPSLKVLFLQLPLASGDQGNGNVRRPLCRYFFKMRKLQKLEELGIRCQVMEKDDFGYSVGFCMRYMKALRRFSFSCLKSSPRLTIFAVEMGFAKAPCLQSLELDNIMIFEEDKPQIETLLRKNLVRTNLISSIISSPLKNGVLRRPPNSSDGEPFTLYPIFQDNSFLVAGGGEKWVYEVQKYQNFSSLWSPQDGNPSGSGGPPNPVRSTFSLVSAGSSEDTESLEFAVASF